MGGVNVKTVEGMQVLRGGSLPEYGRSSGGRIRFVTKSGGRDFHADVFEFYRNPQLDANSWSRNASPLPEQNGRPADYTFHQFGFDIGGPGPPRFNPNPPNLFFFLAARWIPNPLVWADRGTLPPAPIRNRDT